MHIRLSLKLDRNQLPYASAMLMEGRTCLIEAVSPTFNPSSKKALKEYLENVAVKMIREIDTMPDFRQTVQLMILEEIETDNRAGDKIEIPGKARIHDGAKS